MGGVYIGIPAHERSRYTAFWSNLYSIEKPAGSLVGIQIGPFIVNNQNTLVDKFLASDCEYFFLANDDQIYPLDILPCLIARDVDAVVGVVVHRKPPHIPLIYDLIDNQFIGHQLTQGENGLIKIGGAGGGGLLLHRSVFAALPKPYWFVEQQPDGSHGGEDLAFNRKMAQHNIQLWCDTDIRIGHIAEFTLTPATDADGKWRISMHRH